MVVSACGGQKSGSADESTSPTPALSSETVDLPDWPACAEVWVADSDLARGYRGCVEAGTAVPAEKQTCSSGQVLVTHDDRFYAVLGGPVNETDGLAEDADYGRARAACLA